MNESASEPDQIRYLSKPWLEQADELLRALTPIAERVEVAMVVRGGPDGDRSYRMVLGPDRVGIDADTDEGGVRMTMNWDIAVSIATGVASAQRAFLDGHLQLGGDTSLLLGHQQELAAIEDRLQPLRASTVYR